MHSVLRLGQAQCSHFMLRICFVKLYLIRNLFHCVCKLQGYVLKGGMVRNGCFVQEFPPQILTEVIGL